MPPIRTIRLIGMILILPACLLALSLPRTIREAHAQTAEPDPQELGAQLYAENCAVCHGSDGQGRVGATLAKDWPSIRPDLTVKSIIETGVPGSVHAGLERGQRRSIRPGRNRSAGRVHPELADRRGGPNHPGADRHAAPALHPDPKFDGRPEPGRTALCRELQGLPRRAGRGPDRGDTGAGFSRNPPGFEHAQHDRQRDLRLGDASLEPGERRAAERRRDRRPGGVHFLSAGGKPGDGGLAAAARFRPVGGIPAGRLAGGSPLYRAAGGDPGGGAAAAAQKKLARSRAENLVVNQSMTGKGRSLSLTMGEA